jgi:hypothetical protein
VSKRYHTLAIREDGIWAPQFGAYDRSDVTDELDIYLDQGVRKRDLKIITTGELQAEIIAAVAKLNREAHS